jgi:2-desacetyl-2-hydroxyethyl bacteriochlorophyllide A dehydrogenase
MKMRSYHIDEFGALEGIVLRESDRPEPGPHEVLVRIEASSLNHRDLAIAKNYYRGRTFGPGLIPVSDGAGEIVEAGAAVEGFAAGDRVMGQFRQNWQGGRMPVRAQATDLGGGVNGVLCDYVVFNEESVVKFGDDLTCEQASTLPCAAITAWHALIAVQSCGPHETVLVQGTGGVSVFALQFAKMFGARVIATSSSDAKLAWLKENGADAVINYKTHENWDEEILRLTAGEGVDRVVEVGGAGTLERSLKSTKFGGRVIIIGVLTGPAKVDPMNIFIRRLTVQAISTGSREMFEDMVRAIRNTGIEPVIDKVFPFDRAVDAYRYLDSGAHIGKVVIRHI